MKQTLTYAVKFLPTPEQELLLFRTCKTFIDACGTVSEWCRENHCLSQKKIRDAMYLRLCSEYGLGSQMAQSAISRVIGNYRTIRENHGSPWHGKRACKYTSAGYDAVWNRDYSVSKAGVVSVNTLAGRVKLQADWSHVPEPYRRGRYGTARIIRRNGKWLMLIPMSVMLPDPPRPQRVTGIDLGLRFLAVSYDGDGNTRFHPGKEVTQKRAQYKALRTDLQKRGTRSARKRLKSIGNRENRWMTQVNHRVSKALVAECDRPTLLALEDLKGVRKATERVGRSQRYVQVSWAFFQLRQMVEYKARGAGHTVMLVDPAYTSQTCPKCGTVRKANRKHDKHLYVCANCGYRSNDDRVAAMNIQRLGYQSLLETGVSTS